jgi:hypothetical protein
MKNKIINYLNEHHRGYDTILFNWMMYNYDKLQKLFSEPRIYHSDTWFRELEKEALSDPFTAVISANGKWKVCDMTNRNN